MVLEASSSIAREFLRKCKFSDPTPPLPHSDTGVGPLAPVFLETLLVIRGLAESGTLCSASLSTWAPRKLPPGDGGQVTTQEGGAEEEASLHLTGDLQLYKEQLDSTADGGSENRRRPLPSVR